MDFTPELIALQGAVISADNKHSFGRLTNRGGNEEELNNISEVLRKFFQEKHYLTDEDISEKCKSEIRKICFYFVLNTDFRALDDIVELDSLGHLVWTTPTITTCLFCEIVLKLQLHDYIAEVITYSSPKLSVEILKSLVNGIRYCSAQESIDKLEPLAVATYHSLCRLSFFNYDNEYVTSLISDLYTYFLRLITHFVSPPNNGRLEMLPDEERYVHIGKAFRALLRVTLECVNLFQSPLKFDSEQFAIYISGISAGAVKSKILPHSVKENSDTAILEYLNKCNTAALDKCVELVMIVSVDVFCCWSEHNENDMTLQRSIGELCYHLHRCLEQSPSLSKHMLVSMLPQLSCKPTDIFDVIRDADESSLVANANMNSADKEHWLNAIIQKENLFESDKMIECLLENVTFLKPEACENLYSRSLLCLKETNYENKKASSLAARSFAGVDPSRKCELIIEVFPNRVFHDFLKQPDFELKVNEVFNKLISTSDTSLSEIFDVFIQSPSDVLEKMLMVGSENLKQANLIVNSISQLKPLLEYCCNRDKNSTLLSAIEELCTVPLETETQENSFVGLLSGLCEEINFLKNALLLQILMPYIYKSLVSKDHRTLKLFLTVMKSAYSVEDLEQYRAPLLAMLAQVMNQVRWDIASYTMEAPATLQEAIDVQIPLFSSYKSDIPEKDSKWLKSKLKNAKPLNVFYYKELWNPPGTNFLQVITNQQKIELEGYHIVLAKILNCCTQKEWLQALNSLIEETDPNIALELLHKAVLTITSAEISHRSGNSRNCIRYCFRCLAFVLKERYITDTPDPDQITNILEKLVELTNATNEQDLEDIGQILLPLLASIASKYSVKSVPYVEIVNKLKDGKFAKLVLDVFNKP